METPGSASDRKEAAAVIRAALQDGAGAGDARYIYPEAWEATAELLAVVERYENEKKQTVEEALVEFHETYGLVVNESPIDFTFTEEGEEDSERVELFRLREELVREEHSEFLSAHESEDLVDLADAICDLVYVLVGTAVSYGIPFDKCFAEVQRSNMSKLGEDGKPIVREDGKILKGPSFTPPNLHDIIYGNND